MCRYAFEPEVRFVGGRGDGVAVVVGGEERPVVSDERYCYLLGRDVRSLCEADGRTVGFDESCGGFEGGWGTGCGHGGRRVSPVRRCFSFLICVDTTL